MDKPGNLGRNRRQSWKLAVLDEVVSLSGDELDRLLDTLAQLGGDGGTVAEQIAALRLVATEGRPVGPALRRPAAAGVGASSPHDRGAL
jgi:hypothetical protein